MNRNFSLALNLAAIVVGMTGLAFASVPLYRLFCEATGFAGTPRRAAEASKRVLDRSVTVRFNTDTDAALPWEFRPESKAMRLKVGETGLAYFMAKNLTAKPVTGHAVYNIVPQKAGAYFVKIECFCFQDQTLGAKQVAHMPVSFFIDPAIADDPAMNDVSTITLSYTFFPATSEK